MSTETAAERIHRSMNRFDVAVGALAEREASALREQRRSDAIVQEQAEQERREQAHRHAESRRKWQAAYDDSYRLFGERTPDASADEYPGDYRRRLFKGLQDKLDPACDLAGINGDELNGEQLAKFEPDLFEAALAEAENPSLANLPRDGSLIERHRMDSRSGARTVTFHGRRSFIADMGTPPRRVVAFLGRDGTPIYPYAARALGFAWQPLLRD
jgi:hypothetical protein